MTPICNFNPPYHQGGWLFFPAIQQKSLKIGLFVRVQNFRALASKWRIWKINPIFHFNPPSARGGGGYLFWAILQKSYNWTIGMYANFQGSSFKIINFKNYPYLPL